MPMPRATRAVRLLSRTLRSALAASVACTLGAAPARGQDCNLTGFRIFLDPGHGGSDPGAVGPTGLLEKDVTLDVGLKLRDQLLALGGDVDMSRTDDVFVPLDTRATRANTFGADRFSSIHMNGFSDPSANGTETYVVPNPSPVTRDFGQGIQDVLVASLGLRDRGLKFANFTVLVRTVMPAALSESAFITNPMEESYLADDGFRSAIAQAHAGTICVSLSGMEAPELFESPNALETTPLLVEAQPAGGRLGRLELLNTIAGNRRLGAPRFTADGLRLLFTCGWPHLCETDLTTLQTRPLTEEAATRSAGDESADTPQSTVTLQRSDALSVFIGGNQVWLTRNGVAEALTNDDFVYSDPKLSSTSSLVLVTASSKAGSTLLILDAGTGQRLDLGRLGIGRIGGLNLGYEGTWSPDGRRVLFSLTGDDGHTYVTSDLYVVNADGSDLTRLTDDGSVKLRVAWSIRDQIAFEDASGRIVVAAISPR